MKITLFHFTLFASVLSLGAAFIAQYGFGLAPCELCMMQRVPYGVVIVLSLLGIIKPGCRFWLAPLIAVIFLAGGGIALYHSAVEKHVVQGPSACTPAPAPVGESFDDFRKRIENAPVVACDQPAWVWHGITMAMINTLWSLVLAVVVFIQEGRNMRRLPGDLTEEQDSARHDSGESCPGEYGALRILCGPTCR